MRIIPALLLSSLCTLATLSTPLHSAEIPTDLSQKAKPATIKVLLAKQADDAIIEVKGRYEIFSANEYLVSSGVLNKRAAITAKSDGIHWGELFPALFQLRIVPNDSQSFVLVNGIQYKGCVDIYAINNKINIVNEIDVESYLKSTLTSQFSEKMTDEVLDALAIVARTQAYYFVGRNAHALWHVDAEDVNYLGYGITLQNLPMDKAIERTRHAILTYNNAPFAAAWTKDSAGKTAAYAPIFRKEAFSTDGVQAPLAAKDREKHHWNFSITKSQLAKATGVSKVSGVDLYVEKASSKVYGAKINDGSKSKNLDFFQLQKVLGAQKLKSNDFTVTVKGDNIVFDGFGEGHGVGLCLYSAMLMAEKGDATPKILTSFFPNTQIQKARDLPASSQIVEAEQKAQAKR